MCSSSQLERSVRNPSTGFVVGLRQASQEPSATCWSLLVRGKVTLATCTMWGFLFSQLEVFNFLFQHCGTQECCPPSRLTKCSTSFHLGSRYSFLKREFSKPREFFIPHVAVSVARKSLVTSCVKWEMGEGARRVPVSTTLHNIMILSQVGHVQSCSSTHLVEARKNASTFTSGELCPNPCNSLLHMFMQLNFPSLCWPSAPCNRIALESRTTIGHPNSFKN